MLVTQSCPTLCNAMDCSPPGSSAHGILQAPLPMEFSRQEYWSGLPYPSPGDLPNPRIEPRCPALQVDSLQSEPPGKHESEVTQSCPTLCDSMDSSLHQAPPSMGFSRQEYWSGLSFPSSGNIPDPGIEPRSPAL